MSVVLSSTLAGFAFAKLRFRGRPVLYVAVITTMMVPTQLGIVPLYMLMARIGWIDSLAAVIVPDLVTAFGVFFMTQYLADAVPDELLEAGRVDGCSTCGLFWHVILPTARPGAAVLGMFTFMHGVERLLLAAGGADAREPRRSRWPCRPSPAATDRLLAHPDGHRRRHDPVLVVVFGLLGRHIVDGIMQGAIKG